MRLLIPIVGLAAVGCASETQFVYRSTVITETDGVAMSDDGLTSFAAMGGLTCALDVRWGCPTTEDDLPTDEEQVLDHLDGLTLATSAETTLHFMDGGAWNPDRDMDVPSLKTARLSDAGLLTLTSADACALEIDGVTHTVDAEFCGASAYEVDRRGAMLAITDSGVLRADASGMTRLTDHGNLASVDLAHDLVFAATTGEDALRAVDVEGSEVWSVTLDQPVRDLAARGDKGDVLVLTESADGLGQIELLDGATGEGTLLGRVPSAEGSLEVSGNGRTIALVFEGEVHHYEIVVEGEPTPVGEEVECQELPIPNSPGVGFD
ncbi:MAG: hypothetical protein AAF602_13020 [Myxococcota bacterium]